MSQRYIIVAYLGKELYRISHIRCFCYDICMDTQDRDTNNAPFDAEHYWKTLKYPLVFGIVLTIMLGFFGISRFEFYTASVVMAVIVTIIMVCDYRAHTENIIMAATVSGTVIGIVSAFIQYLATPKAYLVLLFFTEPVASVAVSVITAIIIAFIIRRLLQLQRSSFKIPRLWKKQKNIRPKTNNNPKTTS